MELWEVVVEALEAVIRANQVLDRHPHIRVHHRELVLLLLLDLLRKGQEGREHEVGHPDGLLTQIVLLLFNLIVELLKLAPMVLGFGKCDAEQLVLPLGRLNLRAHLLRVDAEVLALVLQVLDVLVVLLLVLH